MTSLDLTSLVYTTSKSGTDKRYIFLPDGRVITDLVPIFTIREINRHKKTHRDIN